MSRTTLIETKRLSLGRFESADLPAFVTYRNRPEVARLQSWETFTPDDGARFLEKQRDLALGTPGRWFQFAVRRKPESDLIGDVGLAPDAEDARLAEIGFTFDPARQGKGYASEAVAAVVDHGFTVLGLHRIRAVIDCRNAPAVRLAERIGMRREAHFVEHAWFKGEWCDEYVYAVLGKEWITRRKKSRTPEARASE